MTSKNLFFNLQKEDLKRRIWSVALTLLVFFLSLPIVCALSVSQNSEYITRDIILNNIKEYLGPQNPLIFIITVIAAVVLGVSGFFYLHSRKKVDLYHSMPVRREVLYATGYVNGVLIYTIPYLVNLVFSYAVISANGYMNGEIIIQSISAAAINILFFCFIYAITIAAVMLTGNFIVSCFGAAVFLLYGFLVATVKSLYCNNFFTTFYYRNMESELGHYSPIFVYYDVASQMNENINGSFYLRIIIVIVLTILISVLGLIIYKKRPSEAAGKAMAFEFTKPVIKFLLVIPITLAGGIFFREISQRGSEGWFIFGLIFSLIISYGVIEIIYNFDIRSAFSYKKQLAICGGIVAIIACIFQYDLFHYDSYMPRKDKIESMSISIDGIDTNFSYHNTESRETYDNYISSVEYHLKYMKLTNFNTAYELVKTNLNYNENSENYDNTFSVKYTLKSGKKVYRMYKMDFDKSNNLIKDIFTNTEYKQVHYPIDKWDINNEDVISCYNELTSKDINLTKAERSEFLQIFKSDLFSLTLDDLQDSPVATIMIPIKKNSFQNYYIYSKFTKTIAFLQMHGFDATQNIGIANIKSIDIRNNNYLNKTSITSDENAVSYSVDNDIMTVSYTDKVQIEQIFKNLVSRDYKYNNHLIMKTDDMLEIEVVVNQDQYGNVNRYPYYFRMDSIPDFVKEDIGYNDNK